MNVSIIGSFRKYYKEIKEIIMLFEKYDLYVLSPSNSEITHSVDDFVIFETDKLDLSPAEIQTETLNKILKSDFVYVFNPDGYVGQTTCYEIGVLRTTNIPLIFYEQPKDLPICVFNCDIMKPEKFVYQSILEIKNDNQINIDKNRIRNEFISKNLMICGSMAFYDDMLKISNELKKHGISVIIPKEENFEKENLTIDEFNAFKRKVSNQYLAKIRDSTTYGILVLNNEKRGSLNYIGANTLAEISMAFCWGRSIFLYNNYYTPLLDELLAWDTICLNGDLSKLVDCYKASRYSLNDKVQLSTEINGQLELGDVYEHFYPLPR